jgi:AcrR family transcriptional regulator
MQVRNEQKIQRKKDHILASLRRLLSREVYSRITLQDIAREAGFSKGGLLHYYSSREEIFIELTDNFFQELEKRHDFLLEGDLGNREIAPISALLGVEQFLLDTSNVRIMLNLMLYAFEEDHIMEIIRHFFTRHLEFYHTVIKRIRADSKAETGGETETRYISRLIQVIILFIGVIEIMDPSDLDALEISRCITTLIRG